MFILGYTALTCGSGDYAMVIMLVIVGAIALVAEFIDSSLGMGYGTMLTPVLLAMGLDVRVVVPAILISELFTGATAAVCHHNFGNVDLMPHFNKLRADRRVGNKFDFSSIFPQNLRVAMLLGSCSVVGAVAAVWLTVDIPRMYLKLYIACLLIAVGIFVLLTANRKMRFSWLRTVLLGLIAAFNKGISGGGYGPLVVSGQVLSGQSPKSAIGIVSFSEAMACLAAICVFIIKGGVFDWPLTIAMTGGAILSAPIASFAVSRFSLSPLRKAIGCLTFFLGLLTLCKAFI